MKKVCEECLKEFEAETFGRHVKKHKLTLENYTLKWMHNGIKPTCKCNCGTITTWSVISKNFNEFIHGHHAFGRKKSDDEKRRIGEKNSINMKRYMNEHPEIALKKVSELRAGLTPEIEKKRIESTKQAYLSMTKEDKQKFSERMSERWASGSMKETKLKSAKTFKERFADGTYDFTERNQKLSESISQKYVNGSWKFSKGMHLSVKTGKEHYYRSSWELQYMNFLDNDVDVVSWESEFISIPYEFNGAIHKYIPDFHVERITGHTLVEVKPLALRSIPKNAAKRLAAQEFCKKHQWNYLEWEPDFVN